MKDKKMVVMPVKTEESKASEKKYEDYEVSCAVDTLLKAEEIKEDKELMKFVNKELEKKNKALQKITSTDQIREIVNGSPEDESEEESEYDEEEKPA